MKAIRNRPYGLWDSKISIASIFDQPSTPMYPFQHGDDLYWLQALPDQGGRIALMRQGPEHEECITPDGFNIRSKVHEYGGRCFCLCGDAIVFNNFSDGGVYFQELNGSAVPRLVCPLNKDIVGFADLVYLEPFNTIAAVAEQSREGQDNENLLVAIKVDEPGVAPHALVCGSDFYAAPVFDMDNRLAWIEWDHPYMPWDQSRLCVAMLQSNSVRLTIDEVTVVVDQQQKSVCQPGFLKDGSLVFISDDDANNWWNFYRWNDQSVTELTDDSLEYGEAHWVFGQRRWCQSHDGALIAIATSHNCDQLIEIDIESADKPRSLFQSASISHLSFDGQRILMVVTSSHQPGSIMEFEPKSAVANGIGPQPASTEANTPALVEPICYPTRDGEKCWAYFYPPNNPDFAPPADTLPPLMVMVHGGPTSRTNTAYHPLKQYFVSLGFAILDINHRGSTGYGRAYRQRLLGNWGEVDAMDIADGIEYLVSAGRVDRDAVFIRGGSAGGYAVLRALTRYANLFAGGACYYGIGNLITLSEITHKFEGRYTDQLVGQAFDPETAMNPGSLYIERSPIFEIEQLQAPLILFQGLLDEVVPPEVSREVVSALKARGIYYVYTEYEGEGHGFRQTKTRIDSLEKESKFFRSIINQN